MSCADTAPDIRYKTYAEYVSDLTESCPKYKELARLFNSQGQMPRCSGSSLSQISISIVDVVDNALQAKTYRIYASGQNKDREDLLQQLRHNPSEPRCGKLCGADMAVLDILALRYRIRPEVIRLHFGRLNDEEYPLSAFVKRQYFHLQYDSCVLTAAMHGKCSCLNAQTTIVFAPDIFELVLLPRLELRISHDSFPLPSIGWQTDDIYLHLLRSLSSTDITSACENLVEFMTPFAQLALAVQTGYMSLVQKSFETMQNRSSFENVEDDLNWKSGFVRQMKANLRCLHGFAPEELSQRYARVLQDLEQHVSEEEEQLNDWRAR
ncbi:MAG: hypothetical protein M1820_005267 [Bogoriella megaspora]|nr:MAG: hypothetical protein M1820_005267 [Bogoriella megaspora]